MFVLWLFLWAHLKVVKLMFGHQKICLESHNTTVCVTNTLQAFILKVRSFNASPQSRFKAHKLKNLICFTFFGNPQIFSVLGSSIDYTWDSRIRLILFYKYLWSRLESICKCFLCGHFALIKILINKRSALSWFQNFCHFSFHSLWGFVYKLGYACFKTYH